MSRHVIAAIAVSLVVCGGLAHAQRPATNEPNVAKLLTDVSSIAKDLQKRITELQTNIEASRTSSERGKQVLEEMLSTVKDVHGSIAEDSAIWQELRALLGLWEERRKNALQQSETELRFKKIADEWDTKIKTANTLRDQILTQRATSLSLLRSIEADQKVILAYYDLGDAGKVIESMQQISGQLTTLNQNMQSIVDTTKQVASPAVAQ